MRRDLCPAHGEGLQAGDVRLRAREARQLPEGGGGGWGGGAKAGRRSPRKEAGQLPKGGARLVKEEKRKGSG